MQARSRYFLLVSLLASLLFGSARAEVAVPPLKARVTDLSNTLTADQRAGLEAKLGTFESRKGSQVAVLIVPTTRPETIEQYSIRVAASWKLGRKGVDDGVLLLIAKDDHKMRLEVGYGLEGVLNDATAKRIVSDVIAPRFKESDFYGGISAGTDRILRAIEGEPLPAPKIHHARDPGAEVSGPAQQESGIPGSAGPQPSSDVGVIALFVLLFGSLGVVFVTVTLFSESGIKTTGLDTGRASEGESWLVGETSKIRSSDGDASRGERVSRVKWASIAGTLALILGWIVSGNAVIGMIIGLIVFFLVLTYRRGESWGDGGWGNGHSSDSGGFFGGGGLFGGGGASGDWGD